MTEKTWRKLFALRLQELIERQGLTMNLLSAISGIGEPAIYRYTHCLRTPKVTTALKLAYTLGVDISELIDFGEKVDDDELIDDFYTHFNQD